MLNPLQPFALVLLVLLVSPGLGAGEAEAEQVPSAVQALIDKATQEVVRERTKYDAAAKKVVDRLAADLKKEVEKATKSGNLKLALAIQAQLDAVLQGGVVANVDEQAQSGDLLGEAARPAIVGTWNLLYNNGVRRRIAIDRKGGVTVLGGAGAGSSYALVFDAKHKVYVGHFSPDQGKPETYRLAQGRLEVNHWSTGGDWKTLAPTHTATATREE